MSDLDALRAEVVRLRNLNMGSPTALSVYKTVLDLIDKHAREAVSDTTVWDEYSR